MSENPPHQTSGQPDGLDQLLSDFFTSQMKRPWPAAPAVGTAEPSVLVAARNAPTTPVRNRAAVSGDNGNRARLTLAASVAILLGSCWYLSDGWQPAARSGGTPAAPGSAPRIDMNSGAADGKSGVPGVIGKDSAIKGKDPMGGFKPGEIKIP